MSPDLKDVVFATRPTPKTDLVALSAFRKTLGILIGAAIASFAVSSLSPAWISDPELEPFIRVPFVIIFMLCMLSGSYKALQIGRILRMPESGLQLKVVAAVLLPIIGLVILANMYGHATEALSIFRSREKRQ